jgi:hypothetical protein
VTALDPDAATSSIQAKVKLGPTGSLALRSDGDVLSHVLNPDAAGVSVCHLSFAMCHCIPSTGYQRKKEVTNSR